MLSIAKSFLREPLVHFLLLGSALFLLYAQLKPQNFADDSHVILVNRENLLNFLQYRARTFSASNFGEVLDSLSQDELQRVIRDYVREEALYREAKALQLDRYDYLTRLRLIKQFEFMARRVAETSPAGITEEELQRYYAAHKSQFYLVPRVTFAHVFFSDERQGSTGAERLAERELRYLNSHQVRPDEASSRGERFLYHVNYVDREPDVIADHFGEDMQRQLFALSPSQRVWRGPFRSRYGFHLVLLTHQDTGRQLSLNEVRDQVKDAVREAKVVAQFDASIQSVIKDYTIRTKRIQSREPQK